MGYRVIIGTLIGAAFTGVSLAVVAFFATINSNSGGGFLGPEREWWLIAVITDLVCGLVIGGFSGVVISFFGLDFLKAIIFGGILNGFIVAGFYFYVNGGEFSDGYKFTLYSLIPIGLINAAIVSLITHVRSSLE